VAELSPLIWIKQRRRVSNRELAGARLSVRIPYQAPAVKK
jgi:hypothetical protein